MIPTDTLFSPLPCSPRICRYDSLPCSHFRMKSDLEFDTQSKRVDYSDFELRLSREQTI